MQIDTNEIIVPNWFDKEDLESVLDREMTQERYNDFKRWIENSSIDDQLSDWIRECWYHYCKEQEN